MPTPHTRVHLLRHGEVFNPEKILYGRLPGFLLSELGHKMAVMAAEALADLIGMTPHGWRSRPERQQALLESGLSGLEVVMRLVLLQR